MKVPLLDLKAQFREVEADVRRELDEVLSSQQFILGPKVEALEARIAELCGVRHAVGVSSGTDALLVALMALGVGPGDEVITTPYSFFATVGCVVRLGARPVFVDVEPETMNLRTDAVAGVITRRTRAILPVHLFGRCASMGPLCEAASAANVPVVEDAAQALGAAQAGRRAGSFGLAGCFSFFPSKNLGALGDAGMVTTDDEALAARLRVLRSHGASQKYFHRLIGGNFRLDALQAAALLAKLPHLERWTSKRVAHARRYREELARAGLLAPEGPVALPPPVADGDRDVTNQLVVRVPRREALAAHLARAGVQTEVYYPRPLHLQECFAELGFAPGAFPAAEACAAEALALPVSAELPAGAIEHVVGAIAEFYGAGTQRSGSTS